MLPVAAAQAGLIDKHGHNFSPASILTGWHLNANKKTHHHPEDI
jgi:hypothetical protein